MDQVGWMTSSIGKWLKEEKSFEITGVNLLVSSVLVLFLIGFLSGIKWEQKQSEVINVGNKRFQLVLLSEQQSDTGKVYVPIYKEIP